MTHLKKAAAGSGAIAVLIFGFQNCGEVGISELSSNQIQCSDNSLYQIHLPLNDGDNILRLLQIKDGVTTRTEYPANWQIDGISTNELLSPPECATRPRYQVEVTYQNGCGEQRTENVDFADPRCSPPPPTTPDPIVLDPPPPLPPTTVVIPGTGDAATSCDPNSQPLPLPEGFTAGVVPPIGAEPEIPAACLSHIPDLTTGRVSLPFGPVSSTESSAAEIQVMYGSGFVSRNRSYNNAYSRSCTGNFNEHSLQRRGGFHKNEFISMRFKTLESLDTGSFRIFGHAIGASNGHALMSISECPGDFGKLIPSVSRSGFTNSYPLMRTLNYYAQEPLKTYNSVATRDDARAVHLDKCMAFVTNPDNGIEIRWTNDSRFEGCLLEKNKNYYVNVVFRRANDLQPTCPSTFPLENTIIGWLSQTSQCSFNYVMDRSNWYE